MNAALHSVRFEETHGLRPERPSSRVTVRLKRRFYWTQLSAAWARGHAQLREPDGHDQKYADRVFGRHRLSPRYAGLVIHDPRNWSSAKIGNTYDQESRLRRGATE